MAGVCWMADGVMRTVVVGSSRRTGAAVTVMASRVMGWWARVSPWACNVSLCWPAAMTGAHAQSAVTTNHVFIEFLTRVTGSGETPRAGCQTAQFVNWLDETGGRTDRVRKLNQSGVLQRCRGVELNRKHPGGDPDPRREPGVDGQDRARAAHAGAAGAEGVVVLVAGGPVPVTAVGVAMHADRHGRRDLRRHGER